MDNYACCVERLNADLRRIQQWSVENGLTLNAGKTQAMIICRIESRFSVSPSLASAKLGRGCYFIQ
jgi:hypothetical protein